MRLSYPTQEEALAVCDRIFLDMQAAGALEVGTTAWAIPQQDEGDEAWYVQVSERCAAYLTSDELATIPEMPTA